ncbi:MAG: carbohydrate ABC transporter permease [Trueperaceae bacterium]|nr:MAG: carbohydrate ABC transporter permease [Trueperaceae bacterium]
MSKRPSRGNTVLLHLGLVVLILGGIFPAVWLFLTSLKLDGELIRLPITYLPDRPTLLNYVAVFRDNPFGRFVLNSLVVSLGATLICVLFAALAGYALARLRLPGRKAIMTGIVMTSMFPALVLLVPLYRLFVGEEVGFLSALFGYLEQLGFGFLPSVVSTPNLLNTYAALIIPYVALSLPIATLILTSFFQLIPIDLESAAMVDGSSRTGALFRVVAPLSAPGIVTAGIIVFVNSWNEFLLAFTFNTTLNMRTIPVGIILYQGEFSFDWSIISAALTLGIVPLVVLIIFFQQRIISGLTAGGVKG